MSDEAFDDENDSTIRSSRPTLIQVRAIVDFIQKHPYLAHKKIRSGVTQQKINKLWNQLSNTVNNLGGALKTTKGWIKFWSDKRRSILMKQKQIDEGKTTDTLAPIEAKIYGLCQSVPQTDKPKKKKSLKVEPFNGDDEESMDDLFPDTNELDMSAIDHEERSLNMMEKLVDVMDQQAQAMAQLAQASHNNSKALERLAEASHMQALAVDRLAGSFESITTSVVDVRNAIVSIDYTMKRCYPPNPAQQRQNTNLFS